MFTLEAVDLTSCSAQLFVTPHGATEPTVFSMTVEATETSPVNTVIWCQWDNAYTQSLPEGRLSQFELQIVEPDGDQRIPAVGWITAIGGRNDG